MRAVFLALCLLCWPIWALAQSETTAVTEPAPIAFDEAEFLRLSERAEGVIERGQASNEALETLRGQLNEVRTLANQQRDAAAARVRPVRQRLEALGEPPAEGEEAPEVAALRAELNDQLAVLRAPLLEAEDAHSRADILIKRIDLLIRDRTTQALLRLDPSPLNPVRWGQAGAALRDYGRAISHEFSDNLANASQRTARFHKLPLVGLLFGLSMLLLIRARRWSRALQIWLSDGVSLRWAAVLGLIGALLQIVLPLVGVWLLVRALTELDLFGLRGYFLIHTIGVAGFALYFSTWVSRLLFVPTPKFPALVEVDDIERRQLRNAFIVLGLVFALRSVFVAMAEGSAPQDGIREALPVLLLPLVVLGGIALFRVGTTLRRHAKANAASEGGNPFLARVGVLMGSFCVAAGAVGPILSAIGYTEAGALLVFATALSLLLIAGFYILFRLIGMMTGNVGPTVSPAGSEEEQQRYGALFQVSLGFFFICAAVPLLALIWGMRLSELQEIWVWLREGFNIGDTRISLTDFLTFILIFSIGYMVTRLLQSALRTTVMPNTRLDSGGQNAIVTGTGYIGIFLAALAAIGATGLDLSNLALVASALTVGIGFGLQTIVSNFVSGIILLIERPIKLGDWIEVGSYSGYVSKISVRSTVVETFDRASVVIPNADLIAGAVTNWTHSSMAGRVIVPVGVSYSSDPRKVETILREIAEAHPMVLLNPPPAIIFQGFGADSMDFEIRAILRDVNWMLSSKSDMNYEIARRFREEGIEIPFAQRDIFIKNLTDLKDDGAMEAGDDTSAVS